MSKHNRILLFACVSFILISVSRGATRIAQCLDEKLSGKNSVVYCPTLQMAWDQLEGIVGGPIRMQNEDTLVEIFNKCNCPGGVVPEIASVAMAGFPNQNFVKKLSGELNRKFGVQAPMVSPAESNATTVLLAYAYLSRSLPFPGRFARSRTTKIAFCYGKETNEVEFFGAPESRAGDYASQVAILNYSDPDDFIIRLSSRIRDEFIVCAKIQKPVTLSAGVDTVRKYLDLEHETEIGSERNGKPDYHPGTLSDGDLLAIPVIKLKVKTEYPQLCYRLFTNKGFEHVQLQGVYQSIEFTMDETGAAVRSTAQIEMFGAPAKPRRYVFDKPFLVTLWKEKADQPYFALWAAGPDVMVPGKKVK